MRLLQLIAIEFDREVTFGIHSIVGTTAAFPVDSTFGANDSAGNVSHRRKRLKKKTKKLRPATKTLKKISAPYVITSLVLNAW